MSGSGRGTPVSIIGWSNGEPVFASPGNHLQVTSSFPKIKNLGRVQVRTLARGSTTLVDCPVAYVVIRNLPGNDDVWIGGIDADSPQVNIGMFLHEDEAVILYVTNSNAVKLVSATDYTEVQVIGYLDGDDVEITPGNPPPPDLTAPTVVSVFPADGATNVEWDTPIYAIFSEEMLNTTLTNANITMTTNPSRTTTKDSVDLTKVLIDPTANLAASTAYTITITTNVTDDAEVPNALAVQFQWTFTTKAVAPPPDTTAPTIISTTPANNATNVALSTAITVSFSEDMLNSSISSTTIKLIKTSNAFQLATTYSHSTDGKTITITPTGSGSSVMEYSTAYQLQVVGGSSGVKDNASNALAATQNFAFTTQAEQLTATYSVAGNAYETMGIFDTTKVGAFLNASNSILKNGRLFKKFILYLRRRGTGSGTISIDITNSTGTVLLALKTLNANTLSTTTDTTITIEITGRMFSVGEMVCVSYDDGDDDNGVYVRKSNVNATSDNTATCLRKLSGFVFGTWSTSSSEDVAGIFYS